jgi:GNAT superfamily N-acetyltransferase
MDASLSIRILGPEDWPQYRDARLRALADSPDAFAFTVAQARDLPADTWAARLAAAAVSGQDCPLAAEIGGEVAGLLWAKVDGAAPDVVNLFQMWVAPESRGRGIAAALLREAIDWAKSKNARFIHLGVTSADTPAMRLYLRAGFRNAGPTEPLRAGSPLLSQPMRLDLAA